MDAELERFLEECRSFLEPEELDAAEQVLRGWYANADDSPEWRNTWDRLRTAINPSSKPVHERLVEVIPLLQAMLSGR